MAICTAKRTNGERCRAPAIAGGRVCRAHGGACPQVQAKAKLRLALAADAVAGRLVAIALSKKTKTSDAIAAAKDLLDRAGVVRDRETTGASGDGTVLWEEFIEIHRKRVSNAKDTSE